MASTTRNTVIGVFKNDNTAQAVANDLVSAGITRSNVHVGTQADWYGEAASGGSALTGREPQHKQGGIMGWFENLFGPDTPESDTNTYAEAVRRGNCVVAVDTDDQNRDRVVDILEKHDAIDIDEESASYGAQGSAAAGSYSDDELSRQRNGQSSGKIQDRNVAETGREQTIPVVKEELQVGKRAVQRGGVRVYTRTTEQPVEEQITLHEERVTVDRRPVNRAVTDADAAGLRDQTIEVTEMAEEAVVSKQARVVEEVVVGKQATDRTETVRDTVRSQEVEVEQLGTQTTGRAATTGSSQYTTAFRKDFDTRYASSGGDYNTYAPAYDYGSRMAGNPTYKGRNFDDVEDTLKTDYLRNNPNSSWDRMRGAVRYGWEQVTGKR